MARATRAPKPPTTPSPLPSRALEHGAAAFGARYVKPGFATSPERDLAFALGAGSGFAPLTLLPDLAPGAKAARGAAMNRNVALAELRGLAPIGAEPGAPPDRPPDRPRADRRG